MDKIEEIRAKIGECDDIIIKQLAVRMSHIDYIIQEGNRNPNLTAGAGEKADRCTCGKAWRQ